MQIILNAPGSLTIESVRELLASGDDSTRTQLRVTKSGIAYLSDTVGAENITDLAFRFETYQAGNGYVGPAAANDDAWVRRVHKALSDNWPQPSSTYIDVY